MKSRVSLAIASLFLIGGCAIAAIVIHQFYRVQKELVIQEQQRQLVAIAEMKAAVLSHWHGERIADGIAIASNPALGAFVKSWFQSGADPKVPDRLIAWFDHMRRAYDYSAIQLFDTSGKVRLGSDPEAHSFAVAHLEKALQERQVVFLDFHSHDGGKSVQIGIMAPIKDEHQEVVAVLALWINPARFLYEQLLQWPIQSKSAEAVIVRRSGDEVVYLSDGRHRKDTVLKLRIPINQTDMPVVRAVMGMPVTGGTDYRGVTVLAAASQVPDTPWYLVAKIDESEALAELGPRTSYFAAVTTLCLVVCMFAVSLVWSRRSHRYYRDLYNAELARRSIAAKYETLHRYANDIILLFDESGRILEANERAVEAYGYTREELLTLSARDLRHPSVREELEQHWHQEASHNGAVYETLHCRSDGSPFPVEVSVRATQTGGTSTRLAILRDITERREGELALRNSQADLKRAQAVAHIGSWRLDATRNCLVWSDEMYRIFGVPEGTPPSIPSFLELLQSSGGNTAGQSRDMVLNAEPQEFEQRIRSDGPEKWVRHRMQFEFDNAGSLTGGFGTVQDITGIKLAEEALRKALQERERYLAQLEGVLDSMTEGMVVSDLNGQLFYWNPAALAMHGFASLEECNRLIPQFADSFELWTEDDGVLSIDHWPPSRVLRGETLHRWEVHVRRNDCDWEKVFSYSGTLARNKEGEPLLAVNTMADVTDARKSEEALRAAHEELAAIHANAPVALLVVDQEMRVHKLNARAAQFGGIGIPDVETRIGAAIGCLNALETPEGCGHHDHCHKCSIRRSVLDAIKRGEPQQEIECWVPMLSGKQRQERCLLVSTAVLTTGNSQRALVCAHDITERKRAEETLRESEERFRVAFEEAAAGMAITETDGRLTSVNTAFCEMLGYSREELTGKFHGEITHADDLPASIQWMRRLLAGENLRATFEKRYVNKDGAIVWAQVHAAVLRDRSGSPKHFITQIQDVTDRKRAEEQIRRLNAELEQRVSERTSQLEASNKELEAFSYSVAHDLRTPLRAIDGWSLILAEEYADQLDAQAGQYMERVRSEAQRMGLLIDDLLSLSRLSRSEMQFQRVDLSAIAERVTNRLTRDETGRRIQFVIQPNLIAAGDPRLLELVLQNLLANAVKFTQTRTETVIEVGEIERDAERTFFVRDNGVGFSMAHAGILFGTFQRLHKPGEFPGTGIGLATVKRVIHRHGGRVWAEGQVGQGAVFYFTIGTRARETSIGPGGGSRSAENHHS